MVDQWAVLRRLLCTTQTQSKTYAATPLFKLMSDHGNHNDVIQWSRLNKDIEPCAPALSGLQSSQESRLVDDPPSCTVHNLHSLLALRKRFITEQTLGRKMDNWKSNPTILLRHNWWRLRVTLTDSRGHEGRVHSDVVTLGPQLLQRHLLDPPARGHRRRSDRVVADCLRRERKAYRISLV